MTAEYQRRAARAVVIPTDPPFLAGLARRLVDGESWHTLAREQGTIAARMHRCPSFWAVHVGHLKARPDVRKRLDAKRAAAAERQAGAAARAERQATVAAQVEQRRLAQRLAIRDAREAFWWQEVRS